MANTIKIEVRINEEKNGIEIKFDSKPGTEIMDQLKAAKFRWSQRQGIWYAKQSEQTLSLANELSGKEIEIMATNNKTTKVNKDINLFDLTRTDDIQNNFELYRIYDTKEIAKKIRQELKRFGKLVKFSVTSSYKDIKVSIKEGAFSKDSEVLKAIANYAYKYTQSWNYDKSDSMSDYFNVNFYGTYSVDSVIAWDYKEREITVGEHNIQEQFLKDLAAFNLAEQKRLEKEYQERLAQEKIEREQREKEEKIYREAKAKMENQIVVVDLDEPQYIGSLVTSNLNKCSSTEEYFSAMKEYGSYHSDCEITRKVYMDKESFDLFKNNLLDDFSFMNGDFGGSATNDPRINSMEDFNQMSEAERKTVEWYCNNCIAIYYGGKLCMVIDPQGYSYARYVYFVDDTTDFGKENIKEETNEFDDEKLAGLEFMKVANDLMEKQGGVLNENETRRILQQWIKDYKINFNKAVCQQLPDKFKSIAYKCLNEIDSMTEQLKGIEPGEPITIITQGFIGGVASYKGYFVSCKEGKYAQYDNAQYLTYKDSNKRKKGYYQKLMYGSDRTIIAKGFIDIPDEVLFDISDEGNFVVKKSKYLSFDKQYFDDIIEYLKQENITILANNIKPIF